MTVWTKLQNTYTQRAIFLVSLLLKYSEISRARISPPAIQMHKVNKI